MNVRLIDYDEYRLVLTITPEGEARVINPGMCDITTATMLRRVAERLEADHPPVECEPTENTVEPERPAEPAEVSGSRLDTGRKVWTDGRGHAWDLSIPWADEATANVWRWTGALARGGAPMMHAAGTSVQEPFDVIHVMYGPMSPVVGDRS